jgi:hypothetical protein
LHKVSILCLFLCTAALVPLLVLIYPDFFVFVCVFFFFFFFSGSPSS